VKKALGALGSVLSWAKREGYLAANPAEGITTAVAKGDFEERRLPYDADDLKSCSAKKPWRRVARRDQPITGCRSLRCTRARGWRSLGSFAPADMRREDGIPYLAIEAGNGKKIKTRSSRRRIPIHAELVRLGLLEFVERQKAGDHERLFPELKATRLGSLTAAWSKWWGRHARDLGVIDKRKVMHSFRHLWKDAARAVMPEEHHDAITGHANGSVGRGYGTRSSAPWVAR
jgi:hypothetical protein